MKVFHTVLNAVTFASIASFTHAALYDRGNGMIYDSTQNITWLQDANYAQTSGYDADGRMTWAQANTWADNLVYGGYSDWRLSSANLLNPTDPCHSYYGECDIGENNTRSEIGHLYIELGNLSWIDTAEFGFNYSGSFLNVKNDVYWESEEYEPYTRAAWYFQTHTGTQEAADKSQHYYAWAVRAGDVAAVPVPAAAWLFGAGLLGLTGLARKKRKAA